MRLVIFLYIWGESLPLTWFYHPWLKRRVWCRFPDDVRPRSFRRFLLKIAELEGLFDAEKVASCCNVTLETTKKYLRILRENGLVKVVNESPLIYIFTNSPLDVISRGLEDEVLFGLRLSLEPLIHVIADALNNFF